MPDLYLLMKEGLTNQYFNSLYVAGKIETRVRRIMTRSILFWKVFAIIFLIFSGLVILSNQLNSPIEKPNFASILSRPTSIDGEKPLDNQDLLTRVNEYQSLTDEIPFFGSRLNNVNVKDVRSSKKISLSDRDPIFIDGDTDFHSQASDPTNDWYLGNTRDGSSLEKAYVIDGYNIVGSATIPRIEIRNTNLFFEISNCRLANGLDDGIFFSNVGHGSIFQNTISNNSKGIYLYASNNNNISNNSIYDNRNYGLWIRSSSTNQIINNTVKDNGCYGVLLSFSSDFNGIWKNSVLNHSKYGIYLDSSNYNHLYLNTVANNSFGGIWLVEKSDNNVVSNNTVYDNPYGIYLDNKENGEKN